MAETTSTSSAQPSSKNLFAILDDVEKVRRAMRILNPKLGHNPFYEKQDEITKEHVYFNYKFQNSRVFPDLSLAATIAESPEAIEDTVEMLKILRECRGVCFSTKTGRCVSRGFQKFFNINEKPETLQENINLKEPHHILDKLDGSMVCGILIPVQTTTPEGENITANVIRFRSKMGYNTHVSALTEEYVYGHKQSAFYDLFYMNQSGDAVRLPASVASATTSPQASLPLPALNHEKRQGYLEFSYKWLSKEYTPIWEFVSPESRIVLQYPEPKLTLLAIRHNIDGTYIPYEEMKVDASEYGVDVVRAWSFNDESTAELVTDIKKMKEVEGFVLRFYDGRMYKSKTSWYVELHGSRSAQSEAYLKETELWLNILDNTLDDLIATFETKEKKEQYELFSSKLWAILSTIAQKMQDTANSLRATILEKNPEVTPTLWGKAVHEYSKGKAGGAFFEKACLFFLGKQEQGEAIDFVVASLKKKLQQSGSVKVPKNIKDELLLLSGEKELTLLDSRFRMFANKGEDEEGEEDN